MVGAGPLHTGTFAERVAGTPFLPLSGVPSAPQVPGGKNTLFLLLLKTLPLGKTLIAFIYILMFLMGRNVTRSIFCACNKADVLLELHSEPYEETYG